jgi:transposase
MEPPHLTVPDDSYLLRLSFRNRYLSSITLVEDTMANRRFAVHEIRNIISRMRLGETNRKIAQAGLMGRNKVAALRHLALAQGWLDKDSAMPSNEVIALMLRRPGGPRKQDSSVDPYGEHVLAWVKRGVTGVAIHQTLVRNFGFTGAYNSVKRFLQRHREPEPATIILDFKPGEATQVDFGTGPAIVDFQTGEVFKTWFFVMTLAFSRHQYVEFVLDQRVETWLGCHRRAFESFGGVPQKVILDNPKCAITKACYYDPEVQRAYAECAEGYGFLISPCPVRDPAKKGIVESGVKYVKKNFLPLREFRDLADLNRQAGEWVMGTAGNRVHGTTRERPLTRFAQVEKDFLRKLPDVAPELAAWAQVKLHGDCHVQFEKRRYSAPFTLVHQYLWLRANEKTVQLYHAQTLVAVHPRLQCPGQRSTVQDHLPPEARAYLMADPQWCLEKAEKIGDCCRELVETLFEHKVLDKLRAAQGVIRLAGKYGNKRLEAGCARALEHGTVTYGAVKRILEKGLDQEPSSPPAVLSEVYSGQAHFMRPTQLRLQ